QETLLMGGLAVGSAVAPLLVYAFGGQGAFVFTGIVLPLVGLLLWIPIRRSEKHAVLPGPEFALLQGVPMFAVLPRATLETLSRQLNKGQYPPGTLVIQQGDVGDRFFVVADGVAEVLIDGVRMAETAPGGYFGEIALLRDIPRTATVLAREALVTYELSRQDFLQAMTGSSHAKDLAEQVTTRRLRNRRY
ncbi:MAG: cyclic nucleotide-binding domain-containing protein, partial [Candidatus Nanopelagicales bacterium]